MPHRKKAASNPRKPKLLFHETPLEGPMHQYGSAVLTARNPKWVPAKLIDQSVSSSWVSPQFDKAVEFHFPGCRRRRRHQANNAVRHRSQEAGHNLPIAVGPCRKTAVKMFPPLTFHDSKASLGTGNPSDSLWDFRPISLSSRQVVPNTGLETSPGTLNEKNPRVRTQEPPSSEFHEVETFSVFSPPNTETPEHSLLLSCRNLQSRSSLREILEGRSTPCSKQQDVLCPDSEGLNVSGGPSEDMTSMHVLVEDTPEHEYGVRITWRRRQELMKYLKARGMLKSSEILVKT
ncbi:RAD9, HUS1, RAD1-interacting nuclear orphan protein 1 isoform X2 [Rhinatrema bivittatum]|uniref:RAD9, HUS1, RAD1-interacting nuclear orphan protein 1 isoform X2 n=1 Tax=Rhinatrema bivittatum TaxID=194408 RepID=UPI00112E3A46|nr:RAD9, HUS1, RAD1-interacting nuclear orphan protein 1 isoform X2 [Rhinatrema bivittatum]XP_029455828.1 RAD9, HUS1, RAD1-interacting nuclear orphan protein 1 isoform X2 [Rhinatrema bivittatum]XP_029455829.1 RAD9, HUS1, RAD1-interacting nuclear orphan protein 1 isoform X2 [Rhinatrema bivittatum]